MKPSIGICRIKAIRRLEIGEQTEDYYVIQSGDAEVLVPRRLADHGAIRAPITEQDVARLFAALEAPFRPYTIRSEQEIPDLYRLSPAEVKEKLRRRDPFELVELIRILHNKQNDYTLDKKETDYLTAAMNMVVEEVSHIQKTTKGRVRTQINKLLAAGRKEGRRQLAAEGL